MMKIKKIFSLLSLKFAKNIEWGYVKECLGEYETKKERDEWSAKFWALPMCGQILTEQEMQLELMRELSKAIRVLRRQKDDVNGEDVSYEDADDDWSKIAEFISIKEFQAYTYAMSRLGTLPPAVVNAAPVALNEFTNMILAINAASTYLLTLTIPGATEYGLYDSNMIECCMNVFELLKESSDLKILRNNMIWMFSLSYCDDLQLTFAYGNFAVHTQQRNDIIKCVVQVLYDNYTHKEKEQKRNILSNHYHIKCFEILDEVVKENNGLVADTINLIMEMTLHLHSYHEPQLGAHVSGWFIALLDKYPDVTKTTLSSFIQRMLSNRMPNWASKDEIASLFYAAQYDAALYRKYNISCVDTLKCTIRASNDMDVKIRSVYLIEQIMRSETLIEDSKLREIALIGELLLLLKDRSSGVRCRAAEVLSRCIHDGPQTAMRVLNECFSFMQFNVPAVECSKQYVERPDVMQYAYSFEGYEELEPLVIATPDVIYKRLLNSSNNLDRLLGLRLLEHIVLVNERIIYDTKFAREISSLLRDPITVNRRALMFTLDRLLQSYWKCPIIIDLFARVMCCLMNERCEDLQRHALQCFTSNVLLKIRPVEATTEPEHNVPWRILKAMLTVPREQIRRRLTPLLLGSEAVTAELVDAIISHLKQPMAHEAWSLLVFISSRITNNLDALITILDDLSSRDAHNVKLVAFELMLCCLKNFSHAALQRVFKCLLIALKTGDIWLSLVGPAIRILNGIDGLARATNKWRVQLYKDVASSILKLIEKNEVQDANLESLLGVYTELLANAPNQKVNGQIVRFVYNYVESKAKLKKFTAYETDEERTLNWMIVISGRFALRDDNLAFKTSRIYENLLSKNERPPLINNTLIALFDLSQKHPSIFENNIRAIMSKLNSTYPITRLATYRCLKDLLLFGKIKPTGIILIALLAGLVDNCEQVARQADNFFVCYQEMYDKTIFQQCLKESPFDFNDLPLVRSSASCYRDFTSPLKGEEKSEIRQIIYNYIIGSMDDSSLLSYLGQLKYLAMKTKDAQFLKSTGALDVIFDMIYIMNCICLRTTSKKQNKTDPKDLLQRCLPCIPHISRHLSRAMTPQLQQTFDQFCRAVTVRFSHFAEVNQPTEFWKKYKPTKKEEAAAKSNYGDIGVIVGITEMPLRQYPSPIGTNPVNQMNADLQQLATELGGTTESQQRQLKSLLPTFLLLK